MYSKKFGRILLGFYSHNTNVSSVVKRRLATCPFSWSSACKHRKQLLQRTTIVSSERSVLLCQMSSTQSASNTTVDPEEVRRFQALASKWWDEQGEFAALHSLNDLRVPFIRDNLMSLHRECQPGRPLGGLKILDVGCGGGLLTEPLARLGGHVLGVDPVENSISLARLHSSSDPELGGRLRYRACTVEELLGSEEDVRGEEKEAGEGPFDAVVASEVVEHLADLETFAFCCGHLIKPGGSLFITTINKTNLSYALAIVAAEQILRIVPQGTHDWDKFISPADLERLLEPHGFSVLTVRGMLYNPVTGSWCWSDNTEINYALHAVKAAKEPPHRQAEPEGRA
ncbi:unnamed protein product [Gadus morhua 'NCC']